MNPKVDFYFEKATTWQEEIKKLRTLLLDCDLMEELKWGCPCYSFNKANIALIHTFKEYCAVLFFKGALLKDPAGILVQQTENVQSARQVRFKNLKEVTKQGRTLQKYVYEAVQIEEAGLKITMKTPSQFKMAQEFQAKLDEMPQLKAAFERLTPGRQKAYLLHFSSAVQSKTRELRVAKAIPSILAGKGLLE